MRNVSIAKYGGSSLMEADHVPLIGRITTDDARRQYLVVSAPGDAIREHRVTQKLVALSKHRGKGDDPDAAPIVRDIIDFLVAKYERIYPGKAGIVGDRVRQQFREATLPSNAYNAALKAVGEELQARLLAEALGFQFVDTRNYLVITDDYDNAQVLPETYVRLHSLQSRDMVFVFPGFYGATSAGQIATFSFGGSNKSLSVLGRGLDVALCENYTETPVLAAHPKIVPHAKVISEMTFKEMRDLSYMGFDIFHKEATEPLIGTGITLHVRSIEQYPVPGTLVMAERISDPARPVVGIAYKDGFCSFSVEKPGLNDGEGVLYAMLGVFHDRRIPVEFSPTGIDDISVVVEQSYVRPVVNGIMAELAVAVDGGAQVEVTFRDNIGCLAVAGKGLQRNARVSADIEQVLAENRIEVIADTKGVQRRSFIYAVDMQRGHDAVRVLYDRFIS